MIHEFGKCNKTPSQLGPALFHVLLILLMSNSNLIFNFDAQVSSISIFVMPYS